MSASTDLGLGKVIESSDVKRDAIHIAVAPIEAGVTLYPGQHVGLQNGKAAPALVSVGVVDPYLTHPVTAGQRFWLFLYPQTVTSIRHDWSHPAFAAEDSGTTKSRAKRSRVKRIQPSSEAIIPPVESENSGAQRWISAFADSVGLTYNDLMDAAAEYLRSGIYLDRGELLEGHYVPDEFWDHYEVVTGTTVSHDQRGSFFSCAC